MRVAQFNTSATDNKVARHQLNTQSFILVWHAAQFLRQSVSLGYTQTIAYSQYSPPIVKSARTNTKKHIGSLRLHAFKATEP